MHVYTANTKKPYTLILNHTLLHLLLL